MDVPHSANAYANALRQAIQAAYPNADVQVSSDGIDSSIDVYCDDESEKEEVIEKVQSIADRVFEDSETWIVEPRD